MEGQSINIGNQSNPDNHISLPDRSVSRTHACLEFRGNDGLLLIDKGSKYGTFVNGRKIRSKLVGPSDMITFGHTTFSGNELIMECKKILLQDKVHWEDEFNRLEDHFAAYEKKKKRIKKRHSIKMAIARVGIFIIFFLIFSYIFSEMGIDPNFKTVLIIGASMTAAVVAGFFVPQDRLKKELRSIEEKYEDILVCPNPKCGYSLKSRSFEYWENKRKCPKCQANWVVA